MTEESPLRKEIHRVLQEMETADPETKEYQFVAGNLRTLMEIEALEAKTERESAPEPVLPEPKKTVSPAPPPARPGFAG